MKERRDLLCLGCFCVGTISRQEGMRVILMINILLYISFLTIAWPDILPICRLVSLLIINYNKNSLKTRILLTNPNSTHEFESPHTFLGLTFNPKINECTNIEDLEL